MSKICNNDCLHCTHPDCINDEYGPVEFCMIVAFEKVAGVYSRADEEAFSQEYMEACVLEKEIEAERERKRKDKQRERAKARQRSLSI